MSLLKVLVNSIPVCKMSVARNGFLFANEEHIWMEMEKKERQTDRYREGKKISPLSLYDAVI